MNKKSDIYTVRYTYTMDGRTCHTAWVGRATSSENAVDISSDWYGFEKSGANVIDVQVEVLTLSKEKEE